MKNKSAVDHFLSDIQFLSSIPVQKKYKKFELESYPFDGQLLSISSLYRLSRQAYLSLGGQFFAQVCSTMRALSAQDLFVDNIEFSPTAAEVMWFKDHVEEVSDPLEEVKSLVRFNEISLFHEQNHRILWRLLPPAPKEEKDFRRYLNFAESLVVALDLALGDELGKKTSDICERLKVIYRPGGGERWKKESKKSYRQYLLGVLCTTYYALEVLHNDDILDAVNYVLPNQKAMNKQAVKRGLELSELFTRVTNPQWQERNWKAAQKKLAKIHSQVEEAELYLPDDPLDLEEELIIAKEIFEYFGL